MTERITVRKTCRQRMPLDGADAQALEHALTITERERDAAYAELRKLRPTIAAVFDSDVWTAVKKAKQQIIDTDTGSGTFPGGGPHEDVNRTAYVVKIERRLEEVEQRLKLLTLGLLRNQNTPDKV